MILDLDTVARHARQHRFTSADDLATAYHAVGTVLRSGICEAGERDVLWNIGDRIDRYIRNRWQQIPQPALIAREEIPA